MSAPVLCSTSNRPVEDWGTVLGDSAAVTAMLDRLLHHGHVLKMRSAELAHENRLASAGSRGVKQSIPGPFCWPVLGWPLRRASQVGTDGLSAQLCGLLGFFA